MADPTYAELAKMIDHSLLQPALTDAELEAGCQLAREYDVASVCIKPYCGRSRPPSCWRLRRWPSARPSASRTAATSPPIKVAESEQAMDDGAVELDMVVNIGKVLSKDWRYVADDIRAVVEAAHRRKALVKVIFENCFLQDEHKEQLCRICGEVGADFVKTSTGYGDSRRHRRRPEADAPLLAAARAGQGGRRRAHLRAPAGRAGHRRHPRRRHGDQGDPRRGAAALQMRPVTMKMRQRNLAAAGENVMERYVTGVEVSGIIDENRQLHVTTPLPAEAAGPVRVIILFPQADREPTEAEWLRRRSGESSVRRTGRPPGRHLHAP